MQPLNVKYWSSFSYIFIIAKSIFSRTHAALSIKGPLLTDIVLVKMWTDVKPHCEQSDPSQSGKYCVCMCHLRSLCEQTPAVEIRVENALRHCCECSFSRDMMHKRSWIDKSQYWINLTNVMYNAGLNMVDFKTVLSLVQPYFHRSTVQYTLLLLQRRSLSTIMNN